MPFENKLSASEISILAVQSNIAQVYFDKFLSEVNFSFGQTAL